MKWAAMYIVYNDDDYIEYSIRSLPEEIEHIVVLRTLAPWNGPEQPLDRTSEVVRGLADERITFVEGRWASEAAQRSAALEVVRGLGCDYCLIVDGDEVYETAPLRRALGVMTANPQVSIWRTPWWTYWKSPLWRIEPPESCQPVIAFKVEDRISFEGLRSPSYRPTTLLEKVFTKLARRPLPVTEGFGFLVTEEPFLHHFSYARPSERIRGKVKAFGHASEVRPDWWDDVWVRWDADHGLRDLHPVHPADFPQAVYRPAACLPEVMRSHPYVTHGVNGLTAE